MRNTSSRRRRCIIFQPYPDSSRPSSSLTEAKREKKSTSPREQRTHEITETIAKDPGSAVNMAGFLIPGETQHDLEELDAAVAAILPDDEYPYSEDFRDWVIPATNTDSLLDYTLRGGEFHSVLLSEAHWSAEYDKSVFDELDTLAETLCETTASPSPGHTVMQQHQEEEVVEVGVPRTSSDCAAVSPPTPPSDEITLSIFDRILTAQLFNLETNRTPDQIHEGAKYSCYGYNRACPFYKSRCFSVESNWRPPNKCASLKALLCDRVHAIFGIHIVESIADPVEIIRNVCTFFPKIIATDARGGVSPPREEIFDLPGTDYNDIEEGYASYTDYLDDNHIILNHAPVATLIIIPNREIECAFKAKQSNNHIVNYNIKVSPTRPLVFTENPDAISKTTTKYWTTFSMVNESQNSASVRIIKLDEVISGFKPTFEANSARLLLPTLLDESLFFTRWAGARVFPFEIRNSQVNPVNLIIYQIAICHAAAHFISYVTSAGDHRLAYDEIFSQIETIPGVANIFLCMPTKHV